MHEIRCPSCRLRLRLYQGMGRDVPAPDHCPACGGRVDHADMLAALAEPERDDLLSPRPVGPVSR